MSDNGDRAWDSRWDDERDWEAEFGEPLEGAEEAGADSDSGAADEFADDTNESGDGEDEAQAELLE